MLTRDLLYVANLLVLHCQTLIVRVSFISRSSRGEQKAEVNGANNIRIEYKVLSLTTAQPTYLHSLISVQPLVLLAPHLLSPFLRHLRLLL